jgi:hypothetical protein
MSLSQTAQQSSLLQRPGIKPPRLTPVQIPELIQMITAHLSLQERLQAQRVNHTWNIHTTYTPDEYQKLFKHALQGDNIFAMERLLKDQRVDPSANVNCAITLAGRHGHIELVEWLLQDSRIDPSAMDNYAIQRASKNGHLAVVEHALTLLQRTTTLFDMPVEMVI